MKKKIIYTKSEIGDVEIVDDFLPAPKDLVLKRESTKVTISLSKDSIDFFKSQSVKHHIPYQKMIKAVLDRYADHYKNRKKA